MIRFVLLIPFGVALFLGQSVHAADLSSDLGKQWWKHIEFLADDKLEGRNAGSEGHKKAAAYVSREFERAGLAAGGKKSYIQPVPLVTRQIDEPHSKLEIVRNNQAEAVSFGEEANLSTRVDPSPLVEAGVVFAGYGMKAPDYNYDELSKLDLRGKIALVVTGAGPKELPGAVKSHLQSAGERWKALKAAGAIGVASINTAGDIPWERATLARFAVSMSLSDPSMNDSAGQKISLAINPAKAERYFEGTGHTFKEIAALAMTGEPLPSFELPLRLRAKMAVKRGKVESQNVVGLLPGETDELVAITAHLDHIGIGKPINGDAINNGAMDNASGIAALIEVARMLKGKTFKRGIVFVAVTGEEKGLLGSRYFAAKPSVDGAIVADLNMDMFLPLHPLKLLSILGLNESTLGDDIRAAAEPFGVKVIGDTEPRRNAFIRSDQYSFIRRGIPSLAFKFGYENGSPEEALHKGWLKNRYHAPSDDLMQPVDKDGAGKFLQILAAMAERVATNAERPAWKADSFFKRFATAGE